MDDLLSAVSEACNNVVLHAYRGSAGKLRVSVVVSDDLVDAEVSDSGSGIPECEAEGDHRSLTGRHSLGLGVALIQALAQHVVFADLPDNGMAVRMSFTRLPFGAAPHGYSGAAHNSGLELHDNGKQRSLNSSRRHDRVRAGRIGPDDESSLLGWRTRAA